MNQRMKVNASICSQWQCPLWDHWHLHWHGLMNKSAQEAKLFIRRLFDESNICKGKLSVADRLFTINHYSWVSYYSFCQLV